jgi:hypothetical protein
MRQEMAIRVEPVEQLIRVHTEQTAWDAPDVRYLLRSRPGWLGPKPLQSDDSEGNDELDLTFGNVRVHIHADDDHIRIVLRETPVRAA